MTCVTFVTLKLKTIIKFCSNNLILHAKIHNFQEERLINNNTVFHYKFLRMLKVL